MSNGEHTFLVRGRTGDTVGAADRYTWTVVNAPPVAVDQTLVVIPNQATTVTLSATDDDPLIFKIVAPPAHGVLLGVPPNLTYVPDTNFGGVDSFTFRASDGLAESNLATVTLLVDNTPPVVTCRANPNRLWPPSHRLIDIQASVTVEDSQSGPAGFVLVSVTSNEADSGLGQEDLPNDIQGWSIDTADTSGQVRAERSDTGNGRIYTLTYSGMDVAGNTALCSTIVFVPHNQGQPNPQVTPVDNGTGGRAKADDDDDVAGPVDDKAAEQSDNNEDNPESATLTHALFLPLVTSNAEDGKETAASDEPAANSTQTQVAERQSFTSPLQLSEVSDKTATHQFYLPLIASSAPQVITE